MLKTKLTTRMVAKYLKAVEDKDKKERALRSRAKADALVEKAVRENKNIELNEIIKLQPWEKSHGNY